MLNVLILCGGRSAEHEVSLISAYNVQKAMPKELYNPKLCGVRKDGIWVVHPKLLQQVEDIQQVQLNEAAELVQLNQQVLVPLNQATQEFKVDVIFSLVHGTGGEDGALQGLAELMQVPMVGSGVAASAVCFDKAFSKDVLRQAGLPVSAGCYWHNFWTKPKYAELAAKLGGCLFVKPANAGSSVGVSRCQTATEFDQAVQQAFLFDAKILIEECIVGRECELSVLGNQQPEVSAVAGEIITPDQIYSYEAKYVDSQATTLVIPANLEPTTLKNMRDLARKAFQALGCSGMARVDFFLQSDGQWVINEVNTIPGFTSISMYPKLWAASGLNYPDLIDRLIQLALKRHAQQQQLQLQPK